MKNMNLKRVSDVTTNDLPFTRKTLYDWKHRRKYPEMFVKWGGALFVDLDKAKELAESFRVSKIEGATW